MNLFSAEGVGVGDVEVEVGGGGGSPGRTETRMLSMDLMLH
jgi:hypothetical protein